MKILFILPLIFGTSDGGFSHDIHLKNDIACGVCHGKAEKSEHLEDILLPEKDACLDCHEKSMEFKLSRVMGIKDFSHKSHYTKINNCTWCHLRDNEISLPSMSTCYECHNGEKESNYCGICHSGKEKIFQTVHEKGFKNFHGMEAKDDVKECYMCHSFSRDYEIASRVVPSCSKCHFEENIDFEMHPENFLYTHPVSFKKRGADCLSCHENYSDCVKCHKEEMVYPGIHNDPGWAKKDEGGFHKEYFERDPDYCAVCHLEREPICESCHGGEE